MEDIINQDYKKLKVGDRVKSVDEHKSCKPFTGGIIKEIFQSPEEAWVEFPNKEISLIYLWDLELDSENTSFVNEEWFPKHPFSLFSPFSLF